MSSLLKKIEDNTIENLNDISIKEYKKLSKRITNNGKFKDQYKGYKWNKVKKIVYLCQKWNDNENEKSLENVVINKYGITVTDFLSFYYCPKYLTQIRFNQSKFVEWAAENDIKQEQVWRILSNINNIDKHDIWSEILAEKTALFDEEEYSQNENEYEDDYDDEWEDVNNLQSNIRTRSQRLQRRINIDLTNNNEKPINNINNSIKTINYGDASINDIIKYGNPPFLDEVPFVGIYKITMEYDINDIEYSKPLEQNIVIKHHYKIQNILDINSKNNNMDIDPIDNNIDINTKNNNMDIDLIDNNIDINTNNPTNIIVID